MKGSRPLLLPLTAGIVVLAIFLAGCGGQEVASTWRDREVVIDGVEGEWSKAMYYFDKENVAMGLLNDDEYLYICLAAIDFRQVGQLIRGGLTVWFDPQGGKKKSFGINFPLQMQLDPGNMERKKMPVSMSPEGTPNPEKLREMLEESTKEMVILGPGEDERRRMPVSGSREIKAKLDYSGGKLVYELRVPLVRDEQCPDAIGVNAGEIIGLGFETAEMDVEMIRDRMRDRMSGDMPPGDQGMPGGGMRGGGIRGGRKPGRGRPEKLELWTKVALATEGTPIPQ